MKPDEGTLRTLREMAERSLSREEFDAYVNAPMSDDEAASILELYEWFARRYPTPMQRLAASRKLPSGAAR
jgi:hypothetical protein